MKVYFISGLGADRRVFKNIQLPEGFEVVYLDWIPALTEESLESYALRLGEAIDRSRPFIVVGLSMGGMLATAIARYYKPAATILISSVPSSAHLPGYFKIAAKLRLHKIVPVSFLKSMSVLKRTFTTKTAEDKKLLCQVIRESDPAFIRWAMDAILKWKSEELPASYIHIHGSRDEILPLRYTKPTHIIKGAGHLMVVNQAKEINAILREIFLTLKL